MVAKKYISSKTYSLVQSGVSLPLSALFSVLGISMLFSFIQSTYEVYYTNQIKIAQTQALFNADTGIAKTYEYLFRIEEFPVASVNDTFYIKGDENFIPYHTSEIMPDINANDTYLIKLTKWEDEFKTSTQRRSYATGIAKVDKHIFGTNKIKIKRNRMISLGHESTLAEYQYLTNTEFAGGAPWSFDGSCIDNSSGQSQAPRLTKINEDNRREVNFGDGDIMNEGWPDETGVTCDLTFQTNGTFVMSDASQPQFDMTVTITEDSLGNINDPDTGPWGEGVFQGDPPLDTAKAVCLIPERIYAQKIAEIESDPSDLVIDASSLLDQWNGTYFTRDTLIMTDIEFFTEGEASGFNVRQYWYLIPPYLTPKAKLGGFEMPWVNGLSHLGQDDSCDDPATDVCDPGDDGIQNNNDDECHIYNCNNYKEQLMNFHSSTGRNDGSENGVNGSTTNATNEFNNNCINSNFPWGFKHYDVPEIYRCYNPLNGPQQYDCPGFSPEDYANYEYYYYQDSNINTDPQIFYNDFSYISQFEIDRNGDGIHDHLLEEYKALGGYKTYMYSQPIAIYVKGGPVRVKGRYKGRYTIYTDVFETYQRHAWGQNTHQHTGGTKRDTLWTDIFITGDLINDDSDNEGSLLIAQPEIENNNCTFNTGSDNRLGLVSGANIYVANTIANGAKNNAITNCQDGDPWIEEEEGFHSDNEDIIIHAHMIAFNESFAVQYSNNTYDNANVQAGNVDSRFSFPPYGDGQGLLKYGGYPESSCDVDDLDNDGIPDGTASEDRGKIIVWGGIVQQNRGYVRRNAGGGSPYSLPAGNIGFVKEYNFDCNLTCNGGSPPRYPEKMTCDEEATEIDYKVKDYY